MNGDSKTRNEFLWISFFRREKCALRSLSFFAFFSLFLLSTACAPKFNRGAKPTAVENSSNPDATFVIGGGFMSDGGLNTASGGNFTLQKGTMGGSFQRGVDAAGGTFRVRGGLRSGP